MAGDKPWQLNCYGPILDESRQARENYRGKIPVHYHGPVSASDLSEVMRSSDILVLPSLEEGFGLVVPQALSCGLPCIVSDAVGAKDLIVGVAERGDVFTSGSSQEILELLNKHDEGRRRSLPKIEFGTFNWLDAAEKLLQHSKAASVQVESSHSI